VDKETREQVERIKASGLSKEDKERHIACAKERAREKNILTHGPREERLKLLYGKYIDLAFDYGKALGLSVGRGDLKEATGVATWGTKKDLKRSLTIALKNAEIIPLEG